MVPRSTQPKAQNKRNALTSQGNRGPASGIPNNRVKGQMHLMDIGVDQPTAIFIDALFLSNPAHTIPVLAANFALYEKYFVNGIKAEFVPNQPVTVGGSIGIAPDYDPTDPVPASMAALSASQGYRTCPVTSGLVVPMPNYKGPDGAFVRPSLYCNPTHDDRFTSYGQFKVFAVAPTLSTGDVVGKIILHYDITFHILEPQTSISYAVSGIDRLTAAGTTSHWSATDLATVTMTEGLQLGDVSGVINLASDKILSAIIDTVGPGLDMFTVAGKAVNPGSRIFVRPCRGMLSSTSAYTAADASTYVGGLGTSRSFDPLSTINMPLVNSIATILRDVQIF